MPSLAHATRITVNEPDHNLSLDQLARLIRRRWFLLLQAVIAGAAAGLLIASFASERYEATATVLVGPASGAAPTSAQVGSLSADAAARLVRTRGVAERVSREVAGNPSPGALLGAVSARPDESGSFVNVTAEDASSERAAAIANAFAEEFIAARAASVSDRVEEAIAAGERQLAALPPTSRDRARLRTELAELRATAVLRGIEAEVIDPAVSGELERDFEPVPSTLAGAVLGFLFGLILAFALAALDPRVRSLSEISRLLPVPQLAAVAKARRSRRRRGVPVLSAASEPFQHLRSALIVFGGKDSLRRLVVTSPADAGEGKTVVAANLAVALAKMGLRVCVVDADLRNGQLASQFGIDATRGGLVEMLRGTPAAEASQLFQIPGEQSGNGATPGGAELTVVPAATMSADAAEILAGPRLAEVLAELGAEHDVVIVDAPPVLAAGETLQLAEGASGTILVIRHSHTTRHAVLRSARIVTEAKGTILGVVATGVPKSEVSTEGSGPWPASAGTPIHGG